MTLHVHDATLAYGDTTVLEEVTLPVPDGELLGLLGPNGSGKTTLLRAIQAIHDLDGGRITLDGTDVATLSREDVARRIGYLPQVEGSTPPATVFDTVLLGRQPYFEWRPTEEDRQAVEAVLGDLGIEDLAMREVPTLSGGQRRTVLLARALVQASDALLLDEPTSGLDPKHQHEVMRRVRSAVHESDLVGIVAIHDLDLATRFCDRYAFLYDGKVYAAGGEEVLTEETVGTVYDVPVEVFERNGRTHVVPLGPAEETELDRESVDETATEAGDEPPSAVTDGSGEGPGDVTGT
ncbi:MAG: iron complex transport system ATP-binding protein [Halobacteriales archaeon]|jgi:iron complex transport system ATP-binding protein